MMKNLAFVFIVQQFCVIFGGERTRGAKRHRSSEVRKNLRSRLVNLCKEQYSCIQYTILKVDTLLFSIFEFDF